MTRVYTEPGVNGRSSPTDLHRPKRVGETRRLTDIGNAERFVDDHKRHVRYCYKWGKWLIFDGRRWTVDDSGEVEHLMKKTVRGIYAEAANETDDSKRKEITDHARRSEAKKRMTDALYIARSELVVRPEELDRDPYLLNCENGTIDLRTGKLRDHEREDMLTKLAPVTLDLFAKAPTFDAFLEKILPSVELRNFVQTVIGYAAIGVNTEEILTILYGHGANGKSTLVNAVMEALGDYATQAAPDLLLAKHGTHPTELADLFGKRFVASVETDDGRRMNEGLVKQLTGRDRIKARRMREDFWEFDPTHTLFLATNHRPEVRGTDHAIWRRLKLVPFNVQIPVVEQDKKLPEKLREELPGILAWIVRGALMYKQLGLGEPKEVATATEGYRADMDVLAAWIEERCVVKEGLWCEFSRLHDSYKSWCDESNETAKSKRRFADQLTERGFAKDNGAKNVAIRRGIGLRDDRPDPSRVNDAPPDSEPEAPETLPEAPENVNPDNEAPENVNPENTCKSRNSSERVNEGYRETGMNGNFPPQGELYRSSVNIVNSLTSDEPAPRVCPHGERPDVCLECDLDRAGL